MHTLIGPSPTEEPRISLRVPALTNLHMRWLRRCGCICTPGDHPSGNRLTLVTFPVGTTRQIVPQPVDARRVTRNYLLILPDRQRLREIALPALESILLFPHTIALVTPHPRLHTRGGYTR